MHTAQIDFTFEGDDENDDISDVVHFILAGWERQTQIVERRGPDASLVLPGRYRYFVTLHEAESLDSRNDPRGQDEWYERFWQAGGSTIEVTLLGRSASDGETCRCASPSALVLYHVVWIDIPSPLRCLQCFGADPLYRGPAPDLTTGWDGVRHWQSTYDALDHLNMLCNIGERMAEKQLRDHDGRLAELGRSCARDIEKVWGIPTYTYLHSQRGRSWKSELARRCPSCGGEWLLDETLHGLFDFRCDPCRLLANVGNSVASMPRPNR